jgi:hypothetical protein
VLVTLQFNYPYAVVELTPARANHLGNPESGNTMSDTIVGFNGLVETEPKLPDFHSTSDGPADVPPGIVDQTSTTEAGFPVRVKGDGGQNAADAPNNWNVKP